MLAPVANLLSAPFFCDACSSLKSSTNAPENFVTGMGLTTGVMVGGTGEGLVDMVYGGSDSVTAAVRIMARGSMTIVERVRSSVRKEYVKSRAGLSLHLLGIELANRGVAVRRGDRQLP